PGPRGAPRVGRHEVSWPRRRRRPARLSRWRRRSARRPPRLGRLVRREGWRRVGWGVPPPAPPPPPAGGGSAHAGGQGIATAGGEMRAIALPPAVWRGAAARRLPVATARR